MVSEDKKYHVIGWNVLTHEWFISPLLTKIEALDIYTEMCKQLHYERIEIVQKLTVFAKFIYTLE